MNEKQLRNKIDTASDRYPILAARYERGASLYRSHFVNPIDDARTSVKSLSNPSKAYIVTHNDNGAYLCECYDFHHAAPLINGEPLCKHIIAARLFLVNGEYES